MRSKLNIRYHDIRWPVRCYDEILGTDHDIQNGSYTRAQLEIRNDNSIQIGESESRTAFRSSSVIDGLIITKSR